MRRRLSTVVRQVLDTYEDGHRATCDFHLYASQGESQECNINCAGEIVRRLKERW